MERNRVELLPFYAERILREIAIDFGRQFPRDSVDRLRDRRRRIERLIETSRTALNHGDEQTLNLTRSNLHQALYELIRDAYIATGNEDWPEDWPEGSSKDWNTGWNDDWDTVQ